MVTQFLEHPLAVDPAPVGGMVENVNLPERQQELTGNWIADHPAILTLFVIDARLRVKLTMMPGGSHDGANPPWNHRVG